MLNFVIDTLLLASKLATLFANQTIIGELSTMLNSILLRMVIWASGMTLQSLLNLEQSVLMTDQMFEKLNFCFKGRNIAFI